MINDIRIAELAEGGMIAPFVPYQVRDHMSTTGVSIPVVSYGLSSFGYDIRLDPHCGCEVVMKSEYEANQIDVKNWRPRHLRAAPLKQDSQTGAQFWVLQAGDYALALSVETFNLPRNVTGICVGKSTYARGGLIVNTTPLEAGWYGRLVVELHNAAPMAIRVYAGEGIGQVIFHEGEPCHTAYSDRAGKYQHQQHITPPRI